MESYFCNLGTHDLRQPLMGFWIAIEEKRRTKRLITKNSGHIRLHHSCTHSARTNLPAFVDTFICTTDAGTPFRPKFPWSSFTYIKCPPRVCEGLLQHNVVLNSYWFERVRAPSASFRHDGTTLIIDFFSSFSLSFLYRHQCSSRKGCRRILNFCMGS